VRYIGSKSRLLGFIEKAVEERAAGAETACDLFAGTAAVSSMFKKMGFTVVSSDIMEYSYAFQVAAVEVCEYPRFDALYEAGIVTDARAEIAMLTDWSPLDAEIPEEARRLAGVINYLNSGHENRKFFWNHFSSERSVPSAFMPSDKELPVDERMFFTSENAARIDGIRTLLHKWKSDDLLSEAEFYVLLASLIDAADVAANTTGVYGAYLKKFGGRPGKALEMKVPRLLLQSPAKPHRCYRKPAAEVAAEENFDLLYLDPPYNRRDYAANYHVPELIARGWFDAEPTLSGKTGMIEEFSGMRSDFCLKGKCAGALEAVIKAAVEYSGTRHILMSYSSEGLIPEEEIERIFRSAGKENTYVKLTRGYKRYRSDGDSEERSYSGDTVEEFLYCVEVEK